MEGKEYPKERSFCSLMGLMIWKSSENRRLLKLLSVLWVHFTWATSIFKEEPGIRAVDTIHWATEFTYYSEPPE